MSQVLVRDLDPAVLQRLKQRAARSGRSLQAELKSILENAARPVEDAAALAARIRRSLARRRHSDSAELIADDRNR
jgi:plasmid stability protein